MRTKFLTALVMMVTLTGGRDATGATLTVPGNHATIQAALEQATAGDRIEISPGTYYEADLSLPPGVDLLGDPVSPGTVVIDGRQEGRLLTVESLDKPGTISGITFRNGWARGEIGYDRNGGAILVNNSALVISYCVFEDNRADANGGAIRLGHSSPRITSCVFEGNRAAQGGGALDCCFSSSPQVESCRFTNNTAAWGGGISCRGNSNPDIERCHFTANAAEGELGYGGGLFADYQSLPVTTGSTFQENGANYGGGVASFALSGIDLFRCTLYANGAREMGAGIFTLEATPTVRACIIAFQNGDGIASVGNSLPNVVCSDVFGSSKEDWLGGFTQDPADGGNISVDPQFCSSDGGTGFYLEEDSPCTPEGGACELMGAWPTGCEAVILQVLSFSAYWEQSYATVRFDVSDIGIEPELLLTAAWDEAGLEEMEIPYTSLGGGSYVGITSGQGSGAGTIRLYMRDTEGGWTQLQEATLSALPSLAGIRKVGAYPNPFNPQTKIFFELGGAQRVRVAVYSLNGKLVRTLADRHFEAGRQELPWDGRTDRGQGVSSGIYLVRIVGKYDSENSKITLLK